jgi:hypothetical protein
MLWKIYFWFYLVMTVIGLLFIISKVNLLAFSTAFELISSILGLVVLYSYVFSKPLLPKLLIQIFFWITVVSVTISIIDLFYSLDNILPSYLQSQTITSRIEVIFGLILASPVYYAIYKLAYPKKKK